MNELGVDFKSSWSFNDKGDLELVSDTDNIMQSIINRLNCWLGSFDGFYLEYGSILSSFLGWKKDDVTLGLMEIEMENTFQQDPRLTDYDLNLDYNNDGGVDINVTLRFGDEEYDLNLVITTDGKISILSGDGAVVNDDDEDVEE